MTTQSRLARSEMARLGEDLAARRLSAQGLIIVERNRRYRGGEIDIIARDGPCYVFVEVKTRSGPHFTPGEAVDGRKQQRIRAIALQWMASHGLLESPCRFDVMAIRMQRDPPHLARVEHLPGAF